MESDRKTQYLQKNINEILQEIEIKKYPMRAAEKQE